MNDIEQVYEVFKDIGQVSKEEPVWVIDEVLPTGLTIMGAPPKAYKSTTLMMLASVVAGYKHNRLPQDMMVCSQHQQGHVLGFSGEATAGALRHLLEDGMGVQLDNESRIFIADDPWAWRLDEDGKQVKMLTWLNKLKPKLAFIDPLRNYHVQKEEDSAVIIQLLAPLRAWAIENDSALVIVHHARKLGKDKKTGEGNRMTPEDLRGSSALFGMCDGLIMQSRVGDTLVIESVYKRGEGWLREVPFTPWKGDKLEVLPDHAQDAVDMIKQGKKWAEVCDHFGVGKSTLSKWLKRLGGK